MKLFVCRMDVDHLFVSRQNYWKEISLKYTSFDGKIILKHALKKYGCGGRGCDCLRILSGEMLV